MALMTSNSRTARCGFACRVVWQGRLRLGAPYADHKADGILDSAGKKNAPANRGIPDATSNDEGTYRSRLASAQLVARVTKAAGMGTAEPQAPVTPIAAASERNSGWRPKRSTRCSARTNPYWTICAAAGGESRRSWCPLD